MKKFLSLSSARVAGAAKQAALAAIGAAALSLVAVNASAEMSAPQQRVDFDDLDLAKPHDTEKLYRRLRAASQTVCREFGNYAGERVRDLQRQCMDRALADAIATIGHPSLTTLHAAKSDMKLAHHKAETSPQS
jgi:UrcA family protein